MATPRPNRTSGSTALLATVVIVAVLYFARLVFIPMALAVLLSFLLGPAVARLRRWGWPRVPSVLAVVVVALSILGVIAGLLASQLVELGSRLPQYERNIHQKLLAVRQSSSGVSGHLTRALHDFQEELNPPPPPSASANEQQPVPVEIHQTALSPFQVLGAILGSLVDAILMAGIVVVFVVFMLLEREDFRDRFIRVIGPGRLNVTTRALDETGQRVSRYLRSLCLVNAAFGLIAGTGLYWMGVPNPVLWGILAALLRFVPYVGIWIAATMPVAVAFAVEPGWVRPLSIFAIYFGIDLAMYNFVEPVVYGNSTGLAPLAILFAAVFWTWLWGPVGLLLATPLTVCVAVTGRYFPALRFLGVLLSDEPGLSPPHHFYQRLLAGDAYEVGAVARRYVETKSMEDLYDELLLPALAAAERDRQAGKIDRAQRRFIYAQSRELVEDLAVLPPGPSPEPAWNGTTATEGQPELRPRPLVLTMPLRRGLDGIGALVLERIFKARGVHARSSSAKVFSGERWPFPRERAAAICVVAIAPFGNLREHWLWNRLRSKFPETPIVAALLGNPGEIDRDAQPETDAVAATFRDTVATVLPLLDRSRGPVNAGRSIPDDA